MKKNKRNKKRKKIKIFIGIILLVAILGIVLYFISDGFTKTPNIRTNKKDKDININVKNPEKNGVDIIDINSKSRPVAVMINNIKVARPYHSGLQDAFLVYEIIVEGGLTRLMAVYKDANTARIGSVRSSRHYFLDYALENDALYVHYGWSPQAESDVKSMKINNINGLYDSAFWRDKTLGISSEHTAFTSMEKIRANADKKRYRTTSDSKPLLNYNVGDVDLSTMDNAIIANNVSIKYSNSVTSTYTYDVTTKTYLRSVNGVAHKDYVTKKQYTFKNIITYQVNNSTIPGDTKDRQNLDNLGSGTGYFITNGYAVPIKWEKTSRNSKTIYRYENGEEINVSDGNTFIQIQPKNKELIIN